MPRFISLLIGLVILALGVWAVVAWWGSVLVCGRSWPCWPMLLGIGIILFGLSELWAGEGKETPPSARTVPQGPVRPA